MQVLELVKDLSNLPNYPWRIEGGKLLSLEGTVLAENVDMALWNFISSSPTMMRRLIEECSRLRGINHRLVAEKRAGHWQRERSHRT